jgi:uncharacterized integral membrane protein
MVMRKFLTGVVLIPLGLIFIDFAVANRHLVTVSFDPFGSGDTAFDLPPVPLFAIIITAIIVGVVAGGSATWFRQRRWRRAARQHEADARQARAQLAELRTGAMTPSVLSPSRYEPQRLPAPSQAGSHGAVGRDKQGATL